MEVNLRCDGYFVEDEAWMRACGRYEDFLRENKEGRVVYLELGVGMNTPGIIKYPFWQETYRNPKAVYACLNFSEAYAPREIQRRSVCLGGDIGDTLRQLAWGRKPGAASA